MNSKKLAGMAVLILAFIIGCSGNYGKLKPQAEEESKVTKQELFDNWSDYNIYVKGFSNPRLAVIVFEPKNEDRKILLGGRGNWGTIKDQKTWTDFVKANTKTSQGNFNKGLFGADSTTAGVQEIWGPDNQLYGLIIIQRGWVDAKLVDENTMRLSWQPNGGYVGSPAK